MLFRLNINKGLEIEDTKTRMTSGLFSSRTEEWETPQYVFDYLNNIFKFDIDVCATKDNRKVDNWFSKEHDGLRQNWNLYKSCFMNPPYGKEIIKWMQKAYNESLLGVNVVCLVHSRTDTRWFHDYAMKSSEIWFIKGRLKFGYGKQSAPFPSCVVVFNNEHDTPIIKSVIIK